VSAASNERLDAALERQMEGEPTRSVAFASGAPQPEGPGE
jgi:hypothetical protein